MEGEREREGEARGGGSHAVTSRWEWVIGALGALMVAGTIAFMTREALTRSEGPPDVVVRVDSVRRVSAGWVVAVTARNRGGATAAGVVVEGRAGGAAGETSVATIGYVPPGSHREAGLFFTREPRPVRVRALGYEAP